jgi:hypothetical protein
MGSKDMYFEEDEDLCSAHHAPSAIQGKAGGIVGFQL